MTVVMGGVCHNGQIAKDGKWVAPDGREAVGVGYTPCPKCGGTGCTPAPPTVDERLDSMAREIEALRRQLGGQAPGRAVG